MYICNTTQEVEVIMLTIKIPDISLPIDLNLESLLDSISMREWNSRTIELHGELQWIGEHAEFNINSIKSESILYKFENQALTIYCKQRHWEIKLPLYSETFTADTIVHLKTDLDYIKNRKVYVARNITLGEFYSSWYMPEYTILMEMINKQNIDKTYSDVVIDVEFFGIELPVWYLTARNYPQLTELYIGIFPKEIAISPSIFYSELINPLLIFSKKLYPNKVDLFKYFMRCETPYEGWEIGETVLKSGLCLHAAGDQKKYRATPKQSNYSQFDRHLFLNRKLFNDEMN